MITVRLSGGLGNQMFQYALGRRLSLDRSVPLALDLGLFGNEAPQDTPREYALHCFALDARVPKVHLRLPVPKNRAELGILLVREKLRLAPRVIRQEGAGFDPAVMAAQDGALLIGFFQSERYFAPIADTIRADFRLAVPLTATSEQLRTEIVTAPTSISLHVRRGDYVTNPHASRFHGTMDDGYYQRALDRIGASNARVFVFSDDPDWCAAELNLGLPMTVIDGAGRPPVEDMLLMSTCDHHVLANSSFSWWGAWLDPAPGSVVVAPARWAIDENANFSDIYAEGWVRA
jgi:hypothetical protein